MQVNRLMVLVKGELVRLNKYNVFSMSILVSLVWGVMLYFMNQTIFDAVLPLILLVDATMMSFMFIGAVMFFEKNESTISTMLVTPSTNSELVLSKVLANTLHNLFSSFLIIIAFVLLRDVTINYFRIVIAIILATTFHTIIGYFMAFYQKNFQGMMVNIMVIAFGLMVPTVLYELGVIKGEWIRFVLLINPVQSAANIIGASFNDAVINWEYYFSVAYMLIGAILVYRFLVLPRFQDYAVRQSGV